MRALSETVLAEGAAILSERDPDLAGVVRRYGPPPLWAREPCFATLLQIILEQQVSLASARAAYGRLDGVIPAVTPEAFLTLDDATLRAVGFSRQKAGYGRSLAAALIDGSFDLDAVAGLPDERAREELVGLKGVGPWTADTYLLMALGRPDVWPAGDIALQAAVRDLKNLPARPSHDEMVGLAEVWRPLRAVAARILWFHYLGGKG
ncbi:MAG: DNA-3-methyladenine glycosylase 2 family protein [Acidimicrobiia bacterium]|nr:DNA-3-methyladenine glycosylase 2 family protein [Acidimicrobiia bacterium]MDH3397574.1 DNA-3-methyladenine glycosylase 2 family protein [Acidimicrobiia bacterium]